jgi:hypothetical protein
MEGFSLSTAYAQFKFGLDLALEYFTKPVIILLLLGVLLAVWRVLTPNK